jgi:putative hydrolase of the HAD superfamily
LSGRGRDIAGALVLDFGGPVLLTPFELTATAERRLGLPAGRLAFSGPFPPVRDAEWQEVLSGRLSERAYWSQRGEEFAAAMGRSPDRGQGDGTGGIKALMAALFHGPPRGLLRPAALALMSDARAAGLPVGILTNDLRLFQPAGFVTGLALGELADDVIDGSVEGIMKPDPRIYRLSAARLGVRCEDVVFLDDQPVNLAGAEAVGMTAVRVDVTSPQAAFDRARALAGLPPASPGAAAV